MFVLRGHGGVGGSVLEEDVHSAGVKGLVGLSHVLGAGMFVPGGREECRTRGRCLRPSCRGGLRYTRPSTGRCFLSGGA